MVLKDNLTTHGDTVKRRRPAFFSLALADCGLVDGVIPNQLWAYWQSSASGGDRSGKPLEYVPIPGSVDCTTAWVGF